MLLPDSNSVFDELYQSITQPIGAVAEIVAAGLALEQAVMLPPEIGAVGVWFTVTVKD